MNAWTTPQGVVCASRSACSRMNPAPKTPRDRRRHIERSAVPSIGLGHPSRSFRAQRHRPARRLQSPFRHSDLVRLPRRENGKRLDRAIRHTCAQAARSARRQPRSSRSLSVPPSLFRTLCNASTDTSRIVTSVHPASRRKSTSVESPAPTWINESPREGLAQQAQGCGRFGLEPAHFACRLRCVDSVPSVRRAPSRRRRCRTARQIEWPIRAPS